MSVEAEVPGAGLRAWLLSATPASTFQARCQRAYLGWITFRANPIAMTGLFIIITLVLVAIFAPWLTASNGLEPVLDRRLQPVSAEHWFGTDQLGRDYLSRIIVGASISLQVGIITVFVAGLIGSGEVK